MARPGPDRRGPGEREPDFPRKQPARDPAPASRRPQLNEYFLEGEGINRQVLQGEICKFLGPEATCRPAEHNGLTGFKIRALRPFTPDMVDDLKALSSEYVHEVSQLQRQSRDAVPYINSDTHNQNSSPGSRGVSYPPSSGSGGNGYGTVTSPYPPDQRHPYGGPSYPPVSGASYSTSFTLPQGMNSMPNYGSSQVDPRQQPNYTYGQPPGREYGQPPGYGYQAGYGYPPGEYADPQRTRTEGMGSNIYYPPGPNSQRIEDPQRAQYYDTQMGGMQAPSQGYGAPRQTNNTSPYESAQRDPYAGRQQSSDVYRRG